MRYWFRPKRYGYGATPSNWKGWLATLAFVALLFGIMRALESGAGLTGGGPLPLLAATVIVTVLFVWIVWKKTDGAWRWRWGPDEKEK